MLFKYVPSFWSGKPCPLIPITLLRARNDLFSVQYDLLANSVCENSVTLFCRLDTGADVSVLPLSGLTRIRASSRKTCKAKDFTGKVSMVVMWDVRILFDDRVYPMRCVHTSGKEGHLGLDFMKHFTVTFKDDLVELIHNGEGGVPLEKGTGNRQPEAFWRCNETEKHI